LQYVPLDGLVFLTCLPALLLVAALLASSKACSARDNAALRSSGGEVGVDATPVRILCTDGARFTLLLQPMDHIPQHSAFAILNLN
jgi:hypothetical protein